MDCIYTTFLLHLSYIPATHINALMAEAAMQDANLLVRI